MRRRALRGDQCAARHLRGGLRLGLFVMAEVDFDTEKFILAVKERPPLWNMLTDEYIDKKIKKKMWEEVTLLFGGSECTNTAERNKLCMVLQKKWKNIKDSFAREKRRLSGCKSGSAAERKSPYIYYNILTFLNTNNPPTNTHSNINHQDPDDTDLTQLDTENPDSTPEPTGPYEARVLAKKRKPKDEVGQQLVKILKESVQQRRINETELASDEDRLFLLSLVTDLKKVPQHLKLTVKREIMKVIDQHLIPSTTSTSTSVGYPLQTNQHYQQPTHSRNNPEYAQGYTTAPYMYPSRQHTSTPLSSAGGSDYSCGNNSSTGSPIYTCFDTVE